MNTPALLIRVSIRPNRSSAWSTVRRAVSASAMSPVTATHPFSFARADQDRATPTTAYPARRYPATRPAPIPCEAPVMIATGWGRAWVKALTRLSPCGRTRAGWLPGPVPGSRGPDNPGVMPVIARARSVRRTASLRRTRAQEGDILSPNRSTRDDSASSNGRAPDWWSWSWTHLRIDRRGPGYCRVTFDHPPMNTITATTVAELSELVGLIEQDRDLKVVVFDSANPDFYLVGFDTAGSNGRHAWPDLLVRLSRAPVVSI